MPEETRILAAWNHQGNPALVHAVVDNPEQRRGIGPGKMGMYVRPLCKPYRPNSYHNTSTPFMRVFFADEDHGKEWDVAGRGIIGAEFQDFELQGHARKCEGCTAALRRRQKEELL